MTIGATLALMADRKPEGLAIVCDDEAVTWRALARAVQSIATTLDVRAADGRCVALALKNSPTLIAHVLACAVTEREAAVIDSTWPRERILQTLEDLAPALVCAEPDLGIEGAFATDTRAPLPCALQDLKPRTVHADSSFYVGFTSGSTGRPKGYRRTHRSWLASFDGDRLEFGLKEKDVVLAPGSMAHSLFLYAAIHGLQIGATILMSRTFHPGRALKLARERQATIAYAAPTQWRMLIDASEEPILSLRWVLSSGAKWFPTSSRELVRLAPHARFAEFYGASELSFVAVRKSGETSPEQSVGRAFAGVTITIRDEDGNESPTGSVGRVFVDSPYLFSGYVGKGDDIARCGNGMSVGDMGFLDASGFLHLTGRRDRMIVSSGKNIFAEEIERALESLPDVRSAAVLGTPDDLRGQRIIALVLPEEGHSPQQAHLRRALRMLLPAPFVPRTFARPHDWPQTPSGKTDFTAMRALWNAGAWEELP